MSRVSGGFMKAVRSVFTLLGNVLDITASGSVAAGPYRTSNAPDLDGRRASDLRHMDRASLETKMQDKGTGGTTDAG
jgi:hypothetical protein